MNHTDVDTDLAELLRPAKALLLDFDGPICDVFGTLTAPTIAQRLRDLIDRDDLPEDVATSGSALYVVEHSQIYGPKILRKIEAAMVVNEIEAVKGAPPTPGAAETIKAAALSGRKVAVVSNNSVAAIQTYLDLHNLTQYVDVIKARTADNVDRLKPDPHLLICALDRLGVTSADAIFVGDSLSDITAARAADVPVIGYANKLGKADRFETAGADMIMPSMIDLASALRNPRSFDA